MDLPPGLGMEEVTEATKLVQRLSTYLGSRSEHCLTWAETAIIINYAGDSPRLLENAEKALKMMESQGQMAHVPVFEEYRLTRLMFFHDYVYVTRLTGLGIFNRKIFPYQPGL